MLRAMIRGTEGGRRAAGVLPVLRVVAFGGALLAGVVAAMAQERPQAFVGGTVLTITADAIDNGVLVVHRGKIAAVGPADTTPIPADAERHDVSGKVLMPGLVDTHSHIGGVGGADSAAPIQPGIRIYDSINPLDAGFRRAVAGGLTTLNIMPGSGHLLSGQTLYAKMRRGNTIEDLFIYLEDPNAPGGRRIAGGLKMANGTNPMRSAPFPGTRAKAAALVREQFIRAIEHRDKIARAEGDAEKMPARDLGLEALIEVMEGERIVHHHTHRADDIMTVIRLAKEFGFKPVIHHASEAWKVADEIAEAGVPCSIILIDAPGGKLETANLSYETGAALERAGVLTAFHTDDWITDSRLFLRMAALGVRGGMSRDAALRALTINGATMLGLDGRIGSLEPGKDADFIVLSGDPLSTYTKVEQTWVEGEMVFDRANADDRLHAVGGYGAGNDQEPYFCCFGHGEAQ